jgi:hypothetical protein
MAKTARRLLLLLLGAALVAGVAVAGVWFVRHGQDDTETQAITPHVVTEPAPGAPVGTDAPVTATGGNVGITVTWSGWDDKAEVLEVDGFVSGVVESGGTCRLTATRSGETVTVEGEGEPDASTTQCGALTIEADELDEGEWRAVLSYESPTSTGAADPVDIEVPAR